MARLLDFLEDRLGLVTIWRQSMSQKRPPKGCIVVNVYSRVLEAQYPSGPKRFGRIFRGSTGRDHLWILAAELEALAKGEMPQALKMRIARFHLIDNTRGEPPMWRREEIEACELDLRPAIDKNAAFEIHGNHSTDKRIRRY